MNNQQLERVYELTKDFVEYHKRAIPLCAAENIISDFANFPLTVGFQERYIMNNTYSFNLDDNFVGCEKLYPFYKELSDICERLFSAKYVDPRPFTGMHCIDMVVKTICNSGDKMMILSKEYGGHASVKPVVERLGIITYDAPYILDSMEIDYEKANEMIKQEHIKFILLAPSDIIRPLSVEKLDTTDCTLLWDCSQLMGLIAAGLCENPLKNGRQNVIMFGGTHKTFPGPASGLILTNDERLHNLMETEINPKYTRHSQMHQKISLLFALMEFEQFGRRYMEKVVHCSNVLGAALKEYGFDIVDVDGISKTHQVFIRTSKEVMDIIYANAYECEVALNKKHKELFKGYGIRLGTQEIARYDYDDKAVITIAKIINELAKKECDVACVKKLIATLPEKKIHYCFDKSVTEKFKSIIEN